MSDGPGDQTFAALLRSLRRRAGLSQAALARRAELNPRSIKYLEGGARQPYPDTLRRLAVALGLSEAERRQLIAAAEPGGVRQAPPGPRSCRRAAGLVSRRGLARGAGRRGRPGPGTGSRWRRAGGTAAGRASQAAAGAAGGRMRAPSAGRPAGPGL